MIKTFTQNDVLKLIYNELEESEADQMQAALCSDQDLENLYHELLTVKMALHNSYKPVPERAIRNILEYSRNK
jgi:hypothetical protein